MSWFSCNQEIFKGCLTIGPGIQKSGLTWRHLDTVRSTVESIATFYKNIIYVTPLFFIKVNKNAKTKNFCVKIPDLGAAIKLNLLLCDVTVVDKSSERHPQLPHSNQNKTSTCLHFAKMCIIGLVQFWILMFSKNLSKCEFLSLN